MKLSAPGRCFGICGDLQRMSVEKRVITCSLNDVVGPARLLQRSAKQKTSFRVERTIQSVHNAKVIPRSLFIVGLLGKRSEYPIDGI